MSMTSLRTPTSVVVALTALLAVISAVTADGTAGTALVVSSVAAGVVLVAAGGAIAGLRRRSRATTVAMALVLDVGHGALMSPRLAADGQPALGIVGIASSLLLIVLTLDAATREDMASHEARE